MDPTLPNPALMEVFFEEVLSEFQYGIARIGHSPTLTDRATRLEELGELCYMNTELMLRYAFVRRDLFREFEYFFEALKYSGEAERPPLDLRDQVNRLFGMLLVTRQQLEKDPRCQF